MESERELTSEDVKAIQLLAKGVLEMYEPPLATINTHLKELTDKQDAVQTLIMSERRKLEDLQNDATLDALLADVAINREKLVSMSSTLMNIHKKIQSLQTRASNVEKAVRKRVASPNRASTS